MSSQRCKISPSALLHPALVGCYVCMAEQMLRKRFNILSTKMKNASLWAISAWLEQEEEGKLVGSRGEGRTWKHRGWTEINGSLPSAWVVLFLFLILFRESLCWYDETANNETLKINSGAGLPCHNLPNMAHKEKDWQANTLRSCWGCPHRAELK